ncbi:MAG: HEAT repeat domain-containing protein [Pseudomonadales bacterium]
MNMETVYIADKSLTELESLFLCDVEDDDYYDVIAFNISQLDPRYLLNHIHEYNGSRLRAAIFGMGLGQNSGQLNELLKSYLGNNNELVVAEAIDALRNLKNIYMWDEVKKLASHESSYVRGAVLRYVSHTLPNDEAYPILVAGLNDPHFIVRENSIDELARLGSGAACQHIHPLVNDRHPDVRQAAKSAIEALSK